MSRPRKHHRHLPPRLHLKHGGYYYVAGGKWKLLARDEVGALRQYYELELGKLPSGDVTFAALRSEYLARGMDALGERTRKDYAVYLERLVGVFGEVALEDIEPSHVAQYHRKRSLKAKVQANREKACFSAVWNWGRAEGITKLPNPAQGIRRNREAGRQVYVDDDTYKAVWDAADQDVRDAMDLAWLTGQRPADVLKMRWDDIHGDELWVRQNKTSEPLRIEISGALESLLTLMRTRASGPRLLNLTVAALDNRFEDARRKAGVPLEAFQFRDLRAKAGTEKTDAEGDRAAQDLLGHRSVKTTETYIRKRIGKKVRAVK